MNKKICILNGSPRMNGNTKELIKKFTEGAKESGNEVVCFDLQKMDIHGRYHEYITRLEKIKALADRYVLPAAYDLPYVKIVCQQPDLFFLWMNGLIDTIYTYCKAGQNIRKNYLVMLQVCIHGQGSSALLNNRDKIIMDL